VLILLLSAAGPFAHGESSEPRSWIDERYANLTDRTERLAIWLDGFFSQSRAVEETPESLIRLRSAYQWDEDDGGDWKLRATGRLYLPATSERLSLVFLGEEGEFDSEFYDPGLVSDERSTVGLEYRLADRERSRVDLTAGLRSGPKGKLGGRYRYQRPLGGRWRLRAGEELFWIGGDGFGTLTRLDLDRRLSGRALLRLAGRAEYSEESNGVEWDTRLILGRRLGDDEALRAFTFIRGETDPRYLKTGGFGAAYRRSFLRRWLFWEVEPSYQWRKERPGDNREGLFSVSARLEIVLGSRELGYLGPRPASDSTGGHVPDR
jgi:hypothetical protein